MRSTTVFIARPVFPDIIDRLRPHFDVRTHDGEAPLSQPELIAALQGCAGVFITGSEKIDATLLDACPRLKAVCTMAVGYNNVDVPACTARGVVVTNAPGVLTETTADFGFALMMATARRISESERFLREGKWKHWGVDMFAGGDVHGATLGILGMGRIGQAIAKRGHGGFDMKVAYHNRSHLAPDVEASLGATWMALPDLLRAVDHLVIVTPYTPETHHLIGAGQIELMKPTATLTNIARGGVVDDAALAEALAAGTIAAAGLDVFEGEPTVHPALLALRNAVLTPHIASASVPTRRAMANLAVDNLLAALGAGPDAGRPPTALNPEVLG
ncbi:2-hydroxyacid dehydrogenase [Scleromatobacter humisilvae]|uniref:D-glycerate dehydrogenase n=1 Tax=Scleromatobacter humisilvae TaxID=2897159 RepID=A0A9X2C0D4_9BURK|nr:D-glycerate dehydrogenase [Scleromatobacter humisilvae]MCK9687212.1 D-glycerate dehydrogenase [Scleromatobacter humisilvae]